MGSTSRMASEESVLEVPNPFCAGTADAPKQSDDEPTCRRRTLDLTAKVQTLQES